MKYPQVISPFKKTTILSYLNNTDLHSVTLTEPLRMDHKVYIPSNKNEWNIPKSMIVFLLFCSLVIWIAMGSWLLFEDGWYKLIIPALILGALGMLIFFLKENRLARYNEAVLKTEIDSYNKGIDANYKQNVIQHVTDQITLKKMGRDKHLFNLYKRIEDEFLKKNTLIISEPQTFSPNQGVSERFFLKYLIESDLGEISHNHMVTNGELKFFPDFVISLFNPRIKINIEIDEPYNGNDFLPIHMRGCKDDQRNKHFLDNGWSVIRFSEYQVITQPHECIQLIRNYIETIKTGCDLIHSVNPMTEWTSDQAEEMALNNYRQSYLPKELFSGLISLGLNNASKNI